MRSFDCHEVELMDRPQPVSQELGETLRELEFLNRTFGAHRYALKFLHRRWKAGSSYRFLDLATGGGDAPRAIVDWARQRQISLRIDAVDSNPAIIKIATRWSSAYPEISYHVADALSFEGDIPYDVVHTALSLHHFPAAQAVALLKRCRELSGGHVLVTDLERSLFTRVAVHFINTLLRHHTMTLRDGDTSARRAFSYREFRALAKGAGWPLFGHERVLFCRQALWLPK